MPLYKYLAIPSNMNPDPQEKSKHLSYTHLKAQVLLLRIEKKFELLDAQNR